MSHDGEVAPRLGGEFHSRAVILLKRLGYIEIVNKKFGLDYGADIPPTRNKLLRPLFAPNGRTAFDFKEGIDVNLAQEARKLKTKIDTLNENHNQEFSGIEGGVIITDNKLGQTAMQRALAQNIYCWDIRLLHFLSKKIEIFAKSKNINRLDEKRLNEWTSYVVSPESFTGFIQLTANIFYHNPIQELSLQTIDEIFNQFLLVTNNYSDLGLPLIVRLRFHSIAEIPVGGEERLKELMEDNDLLKYEKEQCFILGYHLAPWFIYCKEL